MPKLPKTKTAGGFCHSATTKAHRTAVGITLLMVLSFAAKVSADDDVKPAVVYHPGDTVRLVVTFKDTGVSFGDGSARFYLQGEPRDGQKAFPRQFDLNRLSKLVENEYEFSAMIGDQAAAGEYRLEWITGAANGLSRMYNLGRDFQAVITIRIENSKRVDFPDIKNIELKTSGGTVVSGRTTISGGVVIKE